MTNQELGAKLQTLKSLVVELEREYNERTSRIDRMTDEEIDYQVARRYSMLVQSHDAMRQVSQLLAFNVHVTEI